MTNKRWILWSVLAIVALLLIGAGFTLNNFIQAYILGTRQLTEETRVIMSVNPGFGGQTFISGSLEKVRQLKQILTDRHSQALIEIDGGVNGSSFYHSLDHARDIIPIDSMNDASSFHGRTEPALLSGALDDCLV